MKNLTHLLLALIAALAAILPASAQSTVPSHSINSAVLPIWNKGSGKVEALLYLEPAGEQKVGTRWNFNKIRWTWPLVYLPLVHWDCYVTMALESAWSV